MSDIVIKDKDPKLAMTQYELDKRIHEERYLNNLYAYRNQASTYISKYWELSRTVGYLLTKSLRQVKSKKLRKEIRSLLLRIGYNEKD